jgi:GT2 family glycosyltransferase
MAVSLNPPVFVVIPVFNRLLFTRECIRALKTQTYQSIRIIVADGGSTDGTPTAVNEEFPDVKVLTSDRELWWTGSMSMGIDYVLRAHNQSTGFVLMMNNDTLVPDDYVERLVHASLIHDAAVGGLIVDSRDPSCILDAGEYIDWPTYSFPVKTNIKLDESFCDDVDVLPGRGSLVPISMIRVAGNVDDVRFPHYLADYEFFSRLRSKGFRLGVAYDARILAHIEETGIVATTGVTSFRAVWREYFSRRSMNNLQDHWRFVSLHAPIPYRNRLRLRLVLGIIASFSLRTPARPFAQPFYWLWVLPRRIKGQIREIRRFASAARREGISVLCRSSEFPRLIWFPLYLLAAPWPVRRQEIRSVHLDADSLVSENIMRRTKKRDWFVFVTLDFTNRSDCDKLRRLFFMAWNPFGKPSRWLNWRSGAE